MTTKRVYQFYDRRADRLVCERTYASRASAEQYAASHNLIVGGSYAADRPPPKTSDAKAWDDWRAR